MKSRTKTSLIICLSIFLNTSLFQITSIKKAKAGNSDGNIIKTYSDIAHASYEDALISAKFLQSKIIELIDSPSQKTLLSAREAWIKSRVPYQQTEVYRFGNSIVDEWEGRVNSWPLDEGLIDYVNPILYGSTSDKNGLYSANVIANRQLIFNGKTINTSRINKQLLQKGLHEAGGIEANVATGYHAIEFLLWGQDLNGTGAGAGDRPHTDFSLSACTGGNCDRRARYLLTATSLLVDDLHEMTAAWSTGGSARDAILSKGRKGLGVIIKGMGSLSYGELAGERMKLGLLLHDPEEEHDCFSDNTHNSHYFNAIGIRNVYVGRYKRIDGQVVQGVSLADTVKHAAPELHSEMINQIDRTIDALSVIVRSAKNGVSYDQLIAEGNTAGSVMVLAAIDALTAQTRTLEKISSSLGLANTGFEGSDSLDNPDAIFK